MIINTVPLKHNITTSEHKQFASDWKKKSQIKGHDSCFTREMVS